MEDRAAQRIVDLSHVITEGMVTYKGLPGPHICDFLSREQSAANYDGGETFQIGRIEMVANTGTYVDVPSHRFADGKAGEAGEWTLFEIASLDNQAR